MTSSELMSYQPEMRKDCNGKSVYYPSDKNKWPDVQPNFPMNWPEVYTWLGKLGTLVNGKIPAYAGRCTSAAKQRISGVAYGGSTKRKLRPIAGYEVDLVDHKVCDLLEYTGSGYLRPTPSLKFQEQAAINTIKKVEEIFPEKVLVLNSLDACKGDREWRSWCGIGTPHAPKFPEVAKLSEWAEKHNGGYNYYPNWFEKIVRIVTERAK